MVAIITFPKKIKKIPLGMTCQNGEMHLEGESFPQVEETCLVGLPYESVPTTVSHFPNLFCQY